MNEVSKHLSVSIALLQARESVMAYVRPALNEAGITEQQWRIIRLLAENSTLDFQELSEKANILRPSLTGILNRLERGNLVMRLKPASDQRRVFVKLTHDGAKLYTKTSLRVRNGFMQLEQEFGTDKMAQLETLLQELIELSGNPTVIHI